MTFQFEIGDAVQLFVPGELGRGPDEGVVKKRLLCLECGEVYHVLLQDGSVLLHLSVANIRALKPVGSPTDDKSGLGPHPVRAGQFRFAVGDQVKILGRTEDFTIEARALVNDEPRYTLARGGDALHLISFPEASLISKADELLRFMSDRRTAKGSPFLFAMGQTVRADGDAGQITGRAEIGENAWFRVATPAANGLADENWFLEGEIEALDAASAGAAA